MKLPWGQQYLRCKLDRLELSIAQDTVNFTCDYAPTKFIGSTILTRNQLIALVDFCCDDDHRYYANGLHMRGDRAEASDALTLCRANLRGSEHDGVIVNRIALKALLKLSNATSFVFLNYEGFTQVGVSDFVMFIRHIAGQYPPNTDAAFIKQITRCGTLCWDAGTDLAVAQASANKVIHICALGITDVNAMYNAPNIKKCMKHGGSYFKLDHCHRPIQFDENNNGIVTLCVPSRM